MSDTSDRTGPSDAFLRMVGHELRQPLAPILTALEIMRQRRSRESGERARRTIERQVWQLARLVEDLLDYANAQRGTLAIRSEPADLRTVLDAAVETAQPLLAHREQQVELSVPETVMLSGDPARLTQIFANLLNNMARLAEPGTVIAIDVVPRGPDVAVHVRDTSDGISPQAILETFRLFVNAEEEQGWPGVGIGLAVVRTLVELHGGTVEAISPIDGRGAAFVVQLPTATAMHVVTLQGAQRAHTEPDPQLS